MVPETEVRDGVRSLAVPTMASETRTVCRDAGRWICESFVDHHGCRRTRTVWMPKLVWEEQPIALCKMGVVTEPCRDLVVVCKPETRTVTHRVYKPVYETKTRDVTYTVCVLKQVEQEVAETICLAVAEEQVVNCLVTVSETEQREVLVPVCATLPQEAQNSDVKCQNSGARRCRSY
jgi:hypothetical protein